MDWYNWIPVAFLVGAPVWLLLVVRCLPDRKVK